MNDLKEKPIHKLIELRDKLVEENERLEFYSKAGFNVYGQMDENINLIEKIDEEIDKRANQENEMELLI